jgi:hypothetical protein
MVLNDFWTITCAKQVVGSQYDGPLIAVPWWWLNSPGSVEATSGD